MEQTSLRDQLGEALIAAAAVPHTMPIEVLGQAGALADVVLPVVRRAAASAESRAERYRIAWGMARTRAISAGGAADRYAARAREGQEALQHMLFAVIASQLARKAATDEAALLRARVTELEAAVASLRALPVPAGSASTASHDCTPPPTRRLDCGRCPHQVCADCDRCPCSCRCGIAGEGR